MAVFLLLCQKSHRVSLIGFSLPDITLVLRNLQTIMMERIQKADHPGKEIELHQL